MSEERTRVIFRVWEGDIIALFPDDESEYKGKYVVSFQHIGGHVVSFQHIGGHGGADLWLIVKESEPALEHEYEPLMKELTGIGYELDAVLPSNVR